MHVVCTGDGTCMCTLLVQTQTLAEKQTAVYTLQRKLKSCRQSLESKELHLGLVQKKVSMLEERLLSYAQKEEEWKTMMDKVVECTHNVPHMHTTISVIQ